MELVEGATEHREDCFDPGAHGGGVSLEEFRRFAVACETQLPLATLEAQFAEMDPAGHGIICLNDVVHWLMQVSFGKDGLRVGKGPEAAPPPPRPPSPGAWVPAAQVPPPLTFGHGHATGQEFVARDLAGHGGGFRPTNATPQTSIELDWVMDNNLAAQIAALCGELTVTIQELEGHAYLDVAKATQIESLCDRLRAVMGYAGSCESRNTLNNVAAGNFEQLQVRVSKIAKAIEKQQRRQQHRHQTPSLTKYTAHDLETIDLVPDLHELLEQLLPLLSRACPTPQPPAPMPMLMSSQSAELPLPRVPRPQTQLGCSTPTKAPSATAASPMSRALGELRQRTEALRAHAERTEALRDTLLAMVDERRRKTAGKINPDTVHVSVSHQ